MVFSIPCFSGTSTLGWKVCFIPNRTSTWILLIAVAHWKVDCSCDARCMSFDKTCTYRRQTDSNNPDRKVIHHFGTIIHISNFYFQGNCDSAICFSQKLLLIVKNHAKLKTDCIFTRVLITLLLLIFLGIYWPELTWLVCIPKWITNVNDAI